MSSRYGGEGIPYADGYKRTAASDDSAPQAWNLATDQERLGGWSKDRAWAHDGAALSGRGRPGQQFKTNHAGDQGGTVRAITRLLAKNRSERADAAHELQGAVDYFVASPARPVRRLSPSRAIGSALRLGERLGEFGDADLPTNERCLAAMTAAPGKRLVGHSWSSEAIQGERTGRSPNYGVQRKVAAQGPPRPGSRLLEGIQTSGVAALGARVTAFDGRIENLVKTMARVWAYKLSCDVLLWNAERAPPHDLPKSWDVLHHIGVLYHLSNPVEHLDLMLPRTRRGVLLDTHVVGTDADAVEQMEVGGMVYRYHRYGEEHRDISPFAGLEDHAKWLRLDDVIGLLRRHGFGETHVISDRVERNGRRATVFPFRAVP